MLQVNLLPLADRPRDAVALGSLAGLAVPAALVAGLTTILTIMSAETDRLTAHRAALLTRKAVAEREVADIRRIEAETQEAGARMDALVAVAESKTPWSMVLVRLAETLPRGVWLETAQASGDELALTVHSRGTDLHRVADLRRKLREDPLFAHIFDAPRMPRGVDVVRAGEPVVDAGHLRFTFVMRLAGPLPAR